MLIFTKGRDSLAVVNTEHNEALSMVLVSCGSSQKSQEWCQLCTRTYYLCLHDFISEQAGKGGRMGGGSGGNVKNLVLLLAHKLL